MQLNEIKILFSNGVLRDAALYRATAGDGWSIQFGRVGLESLTLDTQRGSVRVFKTVDAALSVVEEIGFKRALVAF